MAIPSIRRWDVKPFAVNLAFSRMLQPLLAPTEPRTLDRPRSGAAWHKRKEFVGSLLCGLIRNMAATRRMTRPTEDRTL